MLLGAGIKFVYSMANIDVGIFQDLDSKNYLRTFVRNEVRPDGRSLAQTRKINIGTGCCKNVLGDNKN